MTDRARARNGWAFLGCAVALSLAAGAWGYAGRCDQGRAWAAVQSAVQAQLRAPASAVFPDAREALEATGACRFRVAGHVDAQNGFGALVRSEFVGTVQRAPGRDFLALIVFVPRGK